MIVLVSLVAALLAGCGGGEAREGGRDLDAALLAAAYANDVDRARDLIERGADVNHKDRTVQSAYLIARSEVGEATGPA